MLIARHGKIVYFEVIGFRDKSVSATGTLFWCDPKRDFFALWMTQAPMQLLRLHSLLPNMV
jgi:hypothetical protein